MIPVFIGGCERSGTTLLGSLLGANKNAVTFPESRFKYFVIQGIRDQENNNAIVGSIRRDKKFHHLRIASAKIDTIDFTALGVTGSIEAFANLYLQSRHRTEVNFWIDHNPDNLANSKLLSANFPEAKFIHIIRDGRAVAASVIPLDWGPNTILKCAQWWLQKLSFCLAAELYLPNEKLIRVRYEELVLHPEDSLRAICEFLGMDYDPVMIAGDNSFISDYTRNQHALVGSRPDPERVTGWKKLLTSFEVAVFEKYAGQMLEFLGYERQNHGYLNVPFSARISWFLKETFLSIKNPLNKKKRLRTP